MPKKQYHSHGPQDFAEFITPEKAYEFDCSLNTPPAFSLKEYKHAAHSHQRCCICGASAWKMAMQGLCFSCTTGESDASEDYELIQL